MPASEARRIVEAVRANGAPVWHVLARDEGHGFARRHDTDFLFVTTIDFLGTCLLS